MKRERDGKVSENELEDRWNKTVVASLIVNPTNSATAWYGDKLVPGDYFMSISRLVSTYEPVCNL